jgi:hypothetical protein
VIEQRTTARALPMLAAVQHSTLEVIEHAESVEDRIETIELVDQRSDAELLEAARLVALIERTPAEAVELARLALIRLTRGIALDSTEDDHRRAALPEVVSIQDLARATVARLAGAWAGGKPSGDAA